MDPLEEEVSEFVNGLDGDERVNFVINGSIQVFTHEVEPFTAMMFLYKLLILAEGEVKIDGEETLKILNTFMTHKIETITSDTETINLKLVPRDD